jgi:hypothetical protein
VNNTQILIVQTKAKAAAKTFVQAGVGAAGTLLLVWLMAEYTDITNGESVSDIDWKGLAGIAAIFCLMGIAALTSLAMNWAKKPEPPPVVIDQPVAVDQ